MTRKLFDLKLIVLDNNTIYFDECGIVHALKIDDGRPLDVSLPIDARPGLNA